MMHQTQVKTGEASSKHEQSVTEKVLNQDKSTGQRRRTISAQNSVSSINFKSKAENAAQNLQQH